MFRTSPKGRPRAGPFPLRSAGSACCRKAWTRQKTRARHFQPSPCSIGRSSVIRTRDPLLPKQVRYQAALYSVRLATRERMVPARWCGACRNGAGYSCAWAGVQAPRAGFLRCEGPCCAAPANRVGTAPVGASPSGKASVFGTDIPRFESWRPSQFPDFDDMNPLLGRRSRGRAFDLPASQRLWLICRFRKPCPQSVAALGLPPTMRPLKRRRG